MLLENEFCLVHWNLIILYGSHQDETESVKNVSACDWSNLVGRLTGKNQPDLFSLALDSNLCGCLGNKAVCLSDRPVWPDETIFNLPLLGGPNRGMECSQCLASE